MNFSLWILALCSHGESKHLKNVFIGLYFAGNFRIVSHQIISSLFAKFNDRHSFCCAIHFFLSRINTGAIRRSKSRAIRCKADNYGSSSESRLAIGQSGCHLGLAHKSHLPPDHIRQTRSASSKKFESSWNESPEIWMCPVISRNIYTECDSLEPGGLHWKIVGLTDLFIYLLDFKMRKWKICSVMPTRLCFDRKKTLWVRICVCSYRWQTSHPAFSRQHGAGLRFPWK